MLLNTEKTINCLESHLKTTKKKEMVFPSETIKPACALNVGLSCSNIFQKMDFIRNKEYMGFFNDELYDFVESKLDHEIVSELGFCK